MSMMRGLMQADTISAIVERRNHDKAVDAINGWIAEAERLQQQLNQANAQVKEFRELAIQNGANCAGEMAAIDTLREALSKLNPAHPLLAKGALRDTRMQARTSFARSHGYDVDQAGIIVKR